MSDDDLATRWAPTLRARWSSETTSDQHRSRQPVQEALDPAQDETWLFSSANESREEVIDHATDSSGAPRTGVMVALFPDPDDANTLALDGGEDPDELHVTLAFLGEVGAELTPDDEQKIIAVVSQWAATQQPITATTNGLGLFHNDPPVTYASVDSPQLPPARQSLIEHLDSAGLAPLQEHGFVPHMTLKYDEVRDHTVPKVPMTFKNATVAFAGHRTHIPLGTPQLDLADPATSDRAYQISAHPRPVRPTRGLPPAPAPQTAHSGGAITVEINGKQLIAAPATASLREPTLDDITNQHLMWMHGKFVGSEIPNRNGALWSAGDLQLARATVVNGPLNWLHEGRHIIGTLADAQYVDVPSGAERAGDLPPHITATAAIWRWIWPDEAYVVQQASDQQQLWYSMECISKEVACMGPGGCGQSTSYAAYMAGDACVHVSQRASVRQFKDPVFLGGAVIVPPARPGWAQADASVMTSAGKIAEAAYAQAGSPDIPASTWEQMMAQLVLAAD